MKKIVLILALFLTVLFAPVVNAATASTRLTNTGLSVKPGATTKVNVVIDASARIRGGQFNLSVNNANFEIVSVVGANGLSISSNNGLYLVYRLEADYSIPSGSSIATITLKAKSTVVGSQSVVSVSNVGVTLAGAYETISAGTKTTTLTVAQPDAPVVPKSTDNTLKSLTSSTVNIAFDANTLNYSVNVANNINEIDIQALANDAKATVAVTGNNNLIAGSNTVLVTVTAESGAVKTYTITVNKDSSANNYLTSLTIEGYDLDNAFDKETTKYNVSIKDTSVTSLNIKYEIEDPKSRVDVIGNEDLIEGRNIIKTIVTSESGEKRIYTLVVNVGTAKVSNVDNSPALSIFIILSIVLFIVAIVEFFYFYKGDNESINEIKNKFKELINEIKK